jgi:uncharacterized protein YjiS (DUF1127 family)
VGAARRTRSLRPVIAMSISCTFDGAPAKRSSVGYRLWQAVRLALEAPLGLLLTWQERAEQRQALAEMSERLTKDLGLTAADIASEVNKPFWRA